MSAANMTKYAYMDLNGYKKIDRRKLQSHSNAVKDALEDKLKRIEVEKNRSLRRASSYILV